MSRSTHANPWTQTLVALGWVALVSIMAPAPATAQEPIDSIVALVDEDVILKSELDQAINMIVMEIDMRGQSRPPRQVLEEQVLERLIRTKLQVLRAEATGIRASDVDIDRALEQLAAANQMSLSQLRQAMISDGMDFDEFRNQIGDEIVANELRRRVGSGAENVSETDIDILLASDQFGGQEYNLSQIALAVSETASPQEASEAEARAREILEELAQGLDFSEAAITYSQSPDALEGGNVGWRGLSEMPPVFADMVQGMSVGDVSDLLRTPNGYIILKVNDIREAQPIIVTEYRARHIMVEPSELLSRDEAEARVRELRQRIVDGEDFGELARRFSTDESSANLGGLLEWIPVNGLGPAFEQEITQLSVGELDVSLSEPFQTQMGWHLLLLEDTREMDRTVEATRDRARNILFNRRAEEEVESFLRQLRSEAFVEIRL